MTEVFKKFFENLSVIIWLVNKNRENDLSCHKCNDNSI